MNQFRVGGYSFGLTAVVIWTGFILVSRQGGLSPLAPTDIIAIRYLTCSALLLPFWLFRYRFNLLNRRMLTVGLVGGLGYALCAFQGFQTAPASHAAVLLPGTMPVLTIILATLLNGEKHPWVKWLGVVLISLGAVSLGWADIFSQGDVNTGHGWFVMAAFCWCVFSVLVKRWQISPWQAVVSLAFITSLFYLPVYLLWLPKNLGVASVQDILLQAVYQGVLATIVQMFCYVTAVRMLGPSTMGSLMALVPVLAGLLAVWLFEEPLTPALITALVLVSSGSWLAHTRLILKWRKTHALREYPNH